MSQNTIFKMASVMPNQREEDLSSPRGPDESVDLQSETGSLSLKRPGEEGSQDQAPRKRRQVTKRRPPTRDAVPLPPASALMVGIVLCHFLRTGDETLGGRVNLLSSPDLMRRVFLLLLNYFDAHFDVFFFFFFLCHSHYFIVFYSVFLRSSATGGDGGIQ